MGTLFASYAKELNQILVYKINKKKKFFKQLKFVQIITNTLLNKELILLNIFPNNDGDVFHCKFKISTCFVRTNRLHLFLSQTKCNHLSYLLHSVLLKVLYFRISLFKEKDLPVYNVL